ncbi:hypothetical protein ISN76_04080 [Dyella halodurans]|uniref:Uncharacterized protein n=1 Tax=Dyella halodurans TaxID=1920171 RepID=A0ABV9BXD6_9GAMM|nr:hypothetical protein [Dyella halodurans]
MLGWLTHAFAAMCPAADAGSITRCSVSMLGVELAAHLPLLGSVLYLPAPRPAPQDLPVCTGWLVAQCELAPLFDTRELVAASMIGAEGPREWIDCMDAQGRPCARLHLLPDTDYLAWDALLAGSRLLPLAPLRPERLVCRAASATLAQFRHRRVGALQLLETMPLAKVSALGRGIAGEVARAAAVELEPTLG